MCAVVVHKRHHRKGKMPVSCRRRCPGALFQSLKDFPFIKTHVWRGGRLNSALARTSARSVIGGGIIRLLHRNRTGGTLVAMLKGNTKGLVGSLVADVVASVRTEPVGHVRENRKPVSLRGALITRMRLLRETPLRRMLLLLIGEKTPPCA